MQMKHFENGTVLFREGDPGTSLYALRKGSVGIYTAYEGSDQQLLTKLEPPALFGEMAVVDRMPRSATAVALADTEVEEIEVKDAAAYFERHPEQLTEVLRMLSGRLRTLTGDYMEVCAAIREVKGDFDAGRANSEGLLAKLKKFAAVYLHWGKPVSAPAPEEAPAQSHSAAEDTVVWALRKDEVIFREGDPSNCMYDILSGSVGIYAGYGTPEEKLLTTLEADSFFGEMGLLDDQPRSATAVALEEGTRVEQLPAPELPHLLKRSPEKGFALLQYLSGRLRRLTQDYMNACRTVAEVTDPARLSLQTQAWIEYYTMISLRGNYMF